MKQKRGISAGTVIMLLITVMVLAGTLMTLIRLKGSTPLTLKVSQDAGLVLLSGNGPEQQEIPLIPVTPAPTAAVTATPAPEVPTATPAPTPVPTATPEPVRGGTITLTFTGAVHLEDSVRQSGYLKDSKKYDYDSIFQPLRSALAGSDAVAGLLDNLINPDAKVSTLNAPEAVTSMLAKAGYTAVFGGFPEAMEQGTASIAATAAQLEKQNLPLIGMTAEEKPAFTLLELNGIKAALFHYTDAPSQKSARQIKAEKAPWALPELSDPSRLTSDFAAAREVGADVIIVSVDWGTAGTHTPTKKQKTLAQQMADAGADLILGTGNQSVQPAQWITGQNADGSEKQTLCCYSLGAVLCDSRKNYGVAGMLLHVTLTVDETGRLSFGETAFTPTYIWRYQQDKVYQYRVVNAAAPAPDGMDSAQLDSMNRAVKTVQSALGTDSPLTMRQY